MKLPTEGWPLTHYKYRAERIMHCIHPDGSEIAIHKTLLGDQLELWLKDKDRPWFEPEAGLMDLDMAAATRVFLGHVTRKASEANLHLGHLG